MWTLCFFPPTLFTSNVASEMSVRMSNLDNERDERDEDSHEDRGISKFCLTSDGETFKYKRCSTVINSYHSSRRIRVPLMGLCVVTSVLPSFSVSNTRFIAAVIERHTHTPERRRRYWGRSGTESDHGKTFYLCICT